MSTIKKNGKLHSTTVNYIPNYILHPKLFECMFCTLNYDPWYTLHPNIKFFINFDEKIWFHLKRPTCPSSQCFKNKKKIIFYHPKLYFLLYFAS